MSDHPPSATWCPWCLKPIDQPVCPVCEAKGQPAEDVRPDGSPYGGKVIEQERYRVSHLLGQGGMGQVYKAYDKFRRHMVAIKVLAPGGPGTTTPVEGTDRIAQEAMATACISNDHVLRFLDWGRTPDGVGYLVTELLRGESLKERLARTPGGRLAPAQAVRIALDVCSALASAHGEGILHRDLKPANLFLESGKAGEERVKVLDFGLAKAAVDTGSTDPEVVRYFAGTPEYVAPEIGFHKPATVQSDLYSLGVVLFEMLAGRRPHEGINALAVMARRATEPVPALPQELGIPESLSGVVARLLDPEPSRRPRSAEEVRGLLQKWWNESVPAAGGPLPSRPPGTAAPEPPPPARTIETPRPPRTPGPEEPRPDWREPSAHPLRRMALVAAGLLAIAMLALGGTWVHRKVAYVPLATVRAACKSGSTGAVLRIRARVAKTRDIPLTEMSLYKLVDDASYLWVLSSAPTPEEGTMLAMRGHPVDAGTLRTSCGRGELDRLICEGAALLVDAAAGSCLMIEDQRE